MRLWSMCTGYCKINLLALRSCSTKNVKWRRRMHRFARLMYKAILIPLSLQSLSFLRKSCYPNVLIPILFFFLLFFLWYFWVQYHPGWWKVSVNDDEWLNVWRSYSIRKGHICFMSSFGWQNPIIFSCYHKLLFLCGWHVFPPTPHSFTKVAWDRNKKAKKKKAYTHQHNKGCSCNISAYMVQKLSAFTASS